MPVFMSVRRRSPLLTNALHWQLPDCSAPEARALCRFLWKWQILGFLVALNATAPRSLTAGPLRPPLYRGSLDLCCSVGSDVQHSGAHSALIRSVRSRRNNTYL